MVGNACTKSIANEGSKLPKMNCTSISKKLLKGKYQCLFEFVNKVTLPQLENRIVASTADLFVMEKTVISEKGKHVIGYVYFLTKFLMNLGFPREQVQ